MLTGKDNPEKVWNFLKSKGFNEYGAAGLMGNLHAESAINPINLQNTYERKFNMTDTEYTTAVDKGTYTNFVKDSAGYGLVQWTYWSRKQALLNYAKQCKKSIGDLEMQLNFMIKELQQYGLLDKLKKATSVYNASTLVLLQYEKPADQSDTVKQRRAGYGQVYYDRFCKALETGTEIVNELKNGKYKVDIQDVPKAVKAVDNAKNNPNFHSLYWILYKLVNDNG